MAKIVFLDDELDMLSTLQDALTYLGHEVMTASDGKVGLRLILEKEPDLAFIDIRLGGIGGLDILRVIKEQKPKIKVIIFTGFNDEQIDLDAVKLGAEMCLHKPTGLQEISDIIDKIVAK